MREKKSRRGVFGAVDANVVRIGLRHLRSLKNASGFRERRVKFTASDRRPS